METILHEMYTLLKRSGRIKTSQLGKEKIAASYLESTSRESEVNITYNTDSIFSCKTIDQLSYVMWYISFCFQIGSNNFLLFQLIWGGPLEVCRFYFLYLSLSKIFCYFPSSFHHFYCFAHISIASVNQVIEFSQSYHECYSFWAKRLFQFQLSKAIT